MCKEPDCNEPIFTQKSGLCRKHYDRAWSAEHRPPKQRVLIKEQPCAEESCPNKGYHRWPTDSDMVLCQEHWDRLRRRGTTEKLVRTIKSERLCAIEGCTKIARSKNEGALCPAHYRRQLINGDPLASRPLGRPRSEGSIDHRKISNEEKISRLAQRRDQREYCVNEHLMAGNNLFVRPNGSPGCKICRSNSQRKYQGKPLSNKPVGPHNAEKTHCPKGHEYTVSNTYFGDGRRSCRLCKMYQRIWTIYKLTPEQWDNMIIIQLGRCEICTDPMFDPHVDHNHETGAVRALLCANCNTMLGHALDDPLRLRAAADYIESYG